MARLIGVLVLAVGSLFGVVQFDVWMTTAEADKALQLQRLEADDSPAAAGAATAQPSPDDKTPDDKTDPDPDDPDQDSGTEATPPETAP